MVVDKNDSIIDPHTINWSQLSKKYFPYLLKQRQGDDNSLGVLKFNFANKYSVYLHDTNVRWMFSRANRALSHGCVRVKDFLKLADFLVRDDTLKHHPDTLRHWIARQEKHIVSGFHRVPIYIRYFSCEGKNGKLRIYDDIYAEDKVLRSGISPTNRSCKNPPIFYEETYSVCFTAYRNANSGVVGPGRAERQHRIDPKRNVARVQYGVASFYHNKFEGRKTANGEIFSQRV